MSMHPALNLTNLYQSYLSVKRVLRHTIWIWPKAEYNKQTLTEITKYSEGYYTTVHTTACGSSITNEEH